MQNKMVMLQTIPLYLSFNTVT